MKGDRALMTNSQLSTLDSQIPKGYKQTEVGVIPEDWNLHSIQELIDQKIIIDHLDGNHGELYPKSHEFQAYGIPYITANDLENRFVSFNKCKFLSLNRARLFRKGIAKNGDVLFAHNATVGPVSLLSTNLDYVILSTTATYFRCETEKLSNYFLLYLLQSPLFIAQYQPVMAQSTRNQVPITAQRKLLVALPPTIAEQNLIASALSDTDTLIESLEQLLAKKRQIKQGAMQELLTGKKRLPGFGKGKGYKQTELGIIPEDWTISKVGEFTITVASGKSHGNMQYAEFPLYGSTGIIGRCITPDYIGDAILVARVGANAGKLSIVSGTYGVTDNTIIIKVNSLIEIEYLWRQLDARNLNSLVFGSGQPLITGTQIKNLIISLPSSKAEQQAIAAILSDMDLEIGAIETKITKARQLKQGMMHQLLTGRIRLVEKVQL